MTAPALFSGTFFSALGWALFHFLWQGALVAGLSGVLTWLLRKRTPTLRYAFSCGALATMLLMPIVTAASLAARASRDSSPTGPASVSSSAIPASGARVPVSIEGAGELLPAALRKEFEALRPWALSIWFAGVLILSLRLAGGLAAAGRVIRRGSCPAPAAWQDILARLASRLSITRPVRLLESSIVKVPTAIGAFQPVILFPATVFLGLPTRGLEALLAHELAHVRRHDYFVNLLQTVAETLLFYHPAVWWISARVRIEREQCCDDLAIAATGDARTYARALIRLEEMRGSAPALAVAAGGGNLWKRVVRLLTQSPQATESPSGWYAGAVIVAMLAVLGAAVRIGASGDRSAGREPAPAVSAVAPVPDAVIRPAPELSAPGPRSPEFPPEIAENSFVEANPAPVPDEPQETPAPETPKMRALTDDELAAFRAHGVTADSVRSIAELGYDRADPDDILALKIHGVTPRDIAEMNGIFGKRPLEEHVSFKIHGVDPETVRQLSALGLGDLSSDDVVSMRIHGVDAAYVEKLRAAGYPEFSAGDAISAKIHGLSPEDAHGWRRLGFANVTLDDLVGARIHGATPEFASRVRSLGFADVSLDDLVSFRIHGVSEDFLREMKSLGFAPPAFSAEDAVAFRIHGVTPDFVRGIRSLGYAETSADDFTELRIHGISTAEIRAENARAGKRIPLEDLLDRHVCGKDGTDEK